ncbi:hypothetical protein DLH72_04540 [Candidatus Gracilibacteria bacterium]|nr:MAG: hypothetical protein DLH72_04540 [Candidatus Gracilibacteria bacterium]
MYNKFEKRLSEVKKRCETVLNDMEKDKNSAYPDTVEKKIKKLEDLMYRLFHDTNDLAIAVRRVIDLDFMRDTLEDMETNIGLMTVYLKRLKENLKEENKGKLR